MNSGVGTTLGSSRILGNATGSVMRSSSLAYMPSIDGLRAVAVAAVVVIHIFPTTTFPGEVGVDVFFVMSGYLITLILLRSVERSGGIDLVRFYKNRVLRLYPPLIVVVAFVVAIGLLPGSSLSGALASGVLALAYVGNIFMTVTGAWMGDLSHTWSLAAEEQFYLVWPAVLLLFARRSVRPRVLGYVLLVTSAVMAAAWLLTGDQTPFNPLTRGFGLVVGCAAAVFTRETRWFSRRLAIAGAALMAMTMAAASFGLVSHTVSTFLTVAGVVWVILDLAHAPRSIAPWLGSAPFAYIGVISYEIYLWHYPILAVLFRYTEWNGLLVAAVGIPLTLAASVLTHTWVSKPVLRWRDRHRTSSS